MADATSGFASERPALPLPRPFGRLMLLKLIARGGMGDVYLATTTGIEGAERPCIVKTVRRDHVHDGSFVARFLDEARVQSQLQHPGVAQILEATTDENGEPYTVVEYIEGRALSDVRQRAIQAGACVEWPDAVAVALEIAQALAHVHERSGPDGTPLGIVHRDLSPQNVMLGYGGEVKIIDFGTARGQNRRCHTVAGVVFAKPGYVAPEVARHEVGDGRIDLYALGVILWELVAGRRFFGGDAQRHLEDAAHGRLVVPALREEFGTPQELDRVVAQLTDNSPERRYASAQLATSDLVRLLSFAPPRDHASRGVRARVAALMKKLWPREPMRSRAEFARLVRESRELRPDAMTPNAGPVIPLLAAKSTPSDPDILAGTPYRIGKKLGEGTSGMVYEAEHIELGRNLAIKVLAPEHGSATDAIERFRGEARAIARLAHPNIVTLYDFGKSLDGRVYLAMERLEGETLAQRLERDGTLPWREAIAIAASIASALEAAHGAALVHRDLKPANLFLTSKGTVKLLDFGVAMALADTKFQVQKQRGFAIFGTPEYMAPEQCSGDPVDERCDLYSLGCVLYEMITGTRPFEGSSAVVVLGKQMREEPEPPCERAPNQDIPRELSALVLSVMSKKRESRFESARAMREALEAIGASASRRRRWTMRAAVIAASAAAIVAIGIVVPKFQTKAPWSTSHAEAASLLSNVTEAQRSPASPSPSLPPTPLPGATAISLTTPASFPAEAAKTSGRLYSLPKRAITRAARADARRALVSVKRQFQTQPKDMTTLKNWAQAAYRVGDVNEVRHAARVWSETDTGIEPRLFLASALDSYGRSNEARHVLGNWITQHPDADDARALLERIGQRIGKGRKAKSINH